MPAKIKVASGHKPKEGINEFECLSNAMRLRRDLTRCLFRDFGMEQLNMTPEQMENYGIFMWFIENERAYVINILRRLVGNIATANSIYPVRLFECDMRRKCQNAAIGNCIQLKQELQYVIETLPGININSYKPFSNALDKEIKLLKKWRTSDNKARRRIEEEIVRRQAELESRGIHINLLEYESEANKKLLEN